MSRIIRIGCFFIFLLACTQVWGDNFISPIPLTSEIDEKKANLGRLLFNDTRLSANGEISCASCHNINKGGMDVNNPSVGVSGEPLDRNSLTVWNTRFNFLHMWDGRASSLKQQALMPMRDKREMAITTVQIKKLLTSDAQYKKLFNEFYNGKTAMRNVADALAEFQSSLIAINAPFDRFLRGDKRAITAQQKNGYKLFKSYGCVACHQGTNVGGNMLQKFGVVSSLSEQHKKDLGRYNVSKLERDKHVFRVPSLRMAMYTAPYFHDGSVNDLKDAVAIMAKYQLGIDLPEQDKLDIVSFIESLAGDIKGLQK